MHLYAIARGQVDHLERWKNDLSSLYFPFKYQPDEPKGKLRLGVRPVEILEIAFPEDCLDDVLKIISPRSGRLTKTTNFLRKLLGLKRIPDFDVNNPMKIHRPFVDVMGIGLKKDRWRCHVCQGTYDTPKVCCDKPTIEFI